MDRFFEDAVWTMIIFMILGTAWMSLETFFYGQPQNRIVDNIISIPVIASIYLNVRHYRKV
ncbi:MAG: hypothetical protein ACI3T9_02155 [Romboutsia timonensis]